MQKNSMQEVLVQEVSVQEVSVQEVLHVRARGLTMLTTRFTSSS